MPKSFRPRTLPRDLVGAAASREGRDIHGNPPSPGAAKLHWLHFTLQTPLHTTILHLTKLYTTTVHSTLYYTTILQYYWYCINSQLSYTIHPIPRYTVLHYTTIALIVHYPTPHTRSLATLYYTIHYYSIISALSYTTHPSSPANLPPRR